MKLEEIKHNFGTNIAKLRKSRNLSQIELGEKIHYSSKAISKWENEETMPDIEVLSMVAEYFDITVDDLISDKNVVRKSYKRRNRFFILLSSALLPFLIGLLTFVILLFFGVSKAYLSFIGAAIASSIVCIVFTSLWFNKKYIYLSIVYCIIGVAMLTMCILDFVLFWLIIIIGVVLMILFFVFFMINFSHPEKR